jgi:hypothetical protein
VTDRTAGVFVVPVGSDARSIKKVTDEIKAVRDLQPVTSRCL